MPAHPAASPSLHIARSSARHRPRACVAGPGTGDVRARRDRARRRRWRLGVSAEQAVAALRAPHAPHAWTAAAHRWPTCAARSSCSTSGRAGAAVPARAAAPRGARTPRSRTRAAACWRCRSTRSARNVERSRSGRSMTPAHRARRSRRAGARARPAQRPLHARARPRRRGGVREQRARTTRGLDALVAAHAQAGRRPARGRRRHAGGVAMKPRKRPGRA